MVPPQSQTLLKNMTHFNVGRIPGNQNDNQDTHIAFIPLQVNNVGLYNDVTSFASINSVNGFIQA